MLIIKVWFSYLISVLKLEKCFCVNVIDEKEDNDYKLESFVNRRSVFVVVDMYLILME